MSPEARLLTAASVIVALPTTDLSLRFADNPATPGIESVDALLLIRAADTSREIIIWNVAA